MDFDFYEFVEGRYGRFLANPRDVYIGRSMIEYGEFSQGEVELLLQLVPTHGIVIEAGANMGCMTIPMAQKVGAGGFVYAFEPQTLVFQQLCTNLVLNNLINVQAIPAGCGEVQSSMKTTRLNPASDNNFGGLTLESLENEASPISIPIERLDDAVSPPRLDLIKADVEGMETEILKGASSLIEQFRPVLYVENHQREHSPRLLMHLFSLNYECWWHLPPLFNPQNHFGKSDNIFGNLLSLNMLCFPAERQVNISDGRKVAGIDDHPTLWT